MHLLVNCHNDSKWDRITNVGLSKLMAENKGEPIKMQERKPVFIIGLSWESKERRIGFDCSTGFDNFAKRLQYSLVFHWTQASAKQKRKYKIKLSAKF